MPVINDLINEVQTLTHDMHNRVDDLDKEQKRLREELTSKSGAMPAEYKAAIDGMNARINELMDAIQEAKLEALRPRTEGQKKGRSAAHAAFIKAVRHRGDTSRLTPEEKALIIPAYMPAEQAKALYASDATQGGFFAATDFIEELQAYRLLISQMRKVCRVQETDGEKVEMPNLQNDTSVYWASEQAQYNDSNDPSLGMINIPVHEMRGMLKVSIQNLEDSKFNLEQFMKDRLMKKFAQKEGASFINGTGNGQPRGILSYPIKASSSYAGGSAGKNNVTDAIPYVATGQASTITADSILNVLMDLKSEYEPNATYLFTRGTLNLIRLFKDSQQRPLWTPFAANELPGMIYSRPYIEMPDMPEVAANAYPIIVGDFSNYMIVDRVQLNFQQLNELFAISSLVAFIARIRVGGDILLPESFRVLKVATS